MAANPIGPNMAVRCVSNAQNPILEPRARLNVGAIYRTDEIHEMGEICPVDQCGMVSVSLQGMPEWHCAIICFGHPTFYCVNQFVPVDDGDTEVRIEEEDMGIYTRPPFVCEPA